MKVFCLYQQRPSIMVLSTLGQDSCIGLIPTDLNVGEIVAAHAERPG